jgi:hypothetical protein
MEKQVTFQPGQPRSEQVTWRWCPEHRSIRHRQSQRVPGIREQPRPKADKDRSGLRKFIIEAHFAGRKSLM